MTETYVYFITWCTYGNWLPGDERGWRKRNAGTQLPRPGLNRWCQEQMRYEPVLLADKDRLTVESACHEHCNQRSWTLIAVSARSNHVHLVVAANASPKAVRDQLKANCTRRLRTQDEPLDVPQTWAKGADVEILDNDDEIQKAVAYVLEAQDCKDRDSDG